MATTTDKAKLAAGAAEIRKAVAEKQTKPAKQAGDTMQFHELAKMFPILPAKEMKDLKADIEKNGIKIPILVNRAKDTILDGRNRYCIALDLGLNPRDPKQLPMEVFKGKDEEVAAEILARNVFRRHLTADQRTAMVTALRAPQLEKEAAERKAQGKKGSFGKDGKLEGKGTVAAQIAKEAKVSQHKAEQALKARKAGALGDVSAGKKSLKQASKGIRGKARAKKEKPLEDRVWAEYSKLLKHFGLELEREVKKILRGFLDNKPTK